MYAKVYIWIDKKEETGQELNDDDILTLVSKTEVPDNDNEEDDNETINLKEKILPSTKPKTV